MKPTPLPEGILIINSTGIGAVSRKRVRERAMELALINGRSALETSKADWDQAKRELGGQPDIDPKEAILEAAPESDRWNPVPGSAGHQAAESPDEDEDAEGRSATERLVEEGVSEASHDQMLQAAKKNRNSAG